MKNLHLLAADIVSRVQHSPDSSLNLAQLVEGLIRQHLPSGTEADVCADIAARQAKGIAKYGTTVADNPLALKQWLQHAYEESLDHSVYLKRAMQEMDESHDRHEGHFINERCPKCGSGLLGNLAGDKWCSFVGGVSIPPCDYGLK